MKELAPYTALSMSKALTAEVVVSSDYTVEVSFLCKFSIDPENPNVLVMDSKKITPMDWELKESCDLEDFQNVETNLKTEIALLHEGKHTGYVKTDVVSHFNFRAFGYEVTYNIKF